MWTWQQLALMEKKLPDFDPPIETAIEISAGDPHEPTDWLLWVGAVTLVLCCLI